jgi:hypothetical protein
VAVTAATPSATVRAFKARILSPDLQTSLLVLPSTYVLRCAPYNAETFDVSAFGGDY